MQTSISFPDGDILAARHYLYAAFQRLFGGKPTKEMLEVLDSELLMESCRLLKLEAPESLRKLLKSALQNDAAISSLQEEYTRLYIGPAKLPASPWESVYRSSESALFQRSTLAVRNAYRTQGFLPQEYPRVADDHISLEVGFLAALAQRALNALVSEDSSVCVTSLEASKDFLEQHLCTWISSYAQDLKKSAEDSVYLEAVFLLISLTQNDLRFSKSIMRRNETG